MQELNQKVDRSLTTRVMPVPSPPKPQASVDATQRAIQKLVACIREIVPTSEALEGTVEAGVSCVKEVAVAGRRRPADIALHSFDSRGPLDVELVVHQPLAPGHSLGSSKRLG